MAIFLCCIQRLLIQYKAQTMSSFQIRGGGGALSGNTVWTIGNIATCRSHLGLKHMPPKQYPCLYVLKQPLVPGNGVSWCSWQFLVAINHITNLTLSFPSQSFQGPNSPLSVWVSMLTFKKTTVLQLKKPFRHVLY